jgi:hypothetical protein
MLYDHDKKEIGKGTEKRRDKREHKYYNIRKELSNKVYYYLFN